MSGLNRVVSRAVSSVSPVTNWLKLSLALLCLFVLSGAAITSADAQAPTPVAVPTWRYDVTHAGANTNETALNTTNVNGSTFGKLFAVPLDGAVYAQPLYLPGLTMGDGLVHNVLFVATEHDSIYAFDADSDEGANARPLWRITLLDAAHGAATGATTVPSSDTGSPDIAPEIGITGTPVIDPATNTLYVVGKTKENGTYVQRLHAINIFNGAERANSPVAITATVAGTGSGTANGQVTFLPLWENQRTALSFYNGHVYFAYGAHGDYGPYHGWIFAYDATTLAQTGVLCTSPNGAAGGVWMSGAGMPIDNGGTAGRMFFVSGNGAFTTYPPFNAGSGLGDSIVALDLAGGKLTPTDAFTPYNQAKLTTADLDQGSGGILMVPDQQGSAPHILVQAGKNGDIMVLNRDSLGGYTAGATSNSNAMQDIAGQVKGVYSTPTYWNGNVYFWSQSDVAKVFSLNGGMMNTTPSSSAPITSAFPGANVIVSSAGTQNGIAWAVRTDQFTTHGPGVVYAFDANNLANVLWESDANVTRDGAGRAMKFAIPVVTNGKVYVAGTLQLDVYGLFNGMPSVIAPVMTPAGGSFAHAPTVTISTATSSATIYYTLDGTLPTPASTPYTGPIVLKGNTTVRAIATASGFIQSPVTTAVYKVVTQTPAVTFSPAGGVYTSSQVVTLSDSDASAKIYYTTDGSTPTTSSTLYTAPLSVASSMTINAIAADPSLPASAVASAAYTFVQPGTIDFSSGFTSTTGLTLNGSAVRTSSNRLQLTSAAASQAGTVFWSQPLAIQQFTTDFTFQLTNPAGDGFTFTMQNAGPTAKGGASSSLGYGGIANSAAIKFDLYSNAGEGNNSTGMYTGGAVPTLPATDMSPSGVSLHSGDTMQAHITYDGTTLALTLTDVVTNKSFSFSKAINLPQVIGANTAYIGFTGSTGGLTAVQEIVNWTYHATNVTAAPVFSPAGGNYSTAQNVSLSSATPGATIYYTTDGSAPTTSSAVYSSPIATSTGTTTIKAIATASGTTQSAVSTATYVIAAPVTATPTFSPAGGNYTSAQTVAITDSTAGAVIYYTLDGSAPTTGSPQYSGPISVGMGTTTINAMAVASGASQSATSTATYVIAPPVTATPTFSPAGGSYTSAQSVTLSDNTAGAVIYYTTDGTTPTTGSSQYSGAISVGVGTTTIQAMAVANGATQSATATATYSVGNPVTADPVFSPAAGTYAAPQSVTLSDSTSGAVIYYTTDGTTPTTSSAVYGAAIQVASTTTIKAMAVAPNAPSSSIVTAAYTIQSVRTPDINYANGFSSAAGLTLNGVSTVTNNLLQVTPAVNNVAGSAFWNQRVNVQAFTSDFTFQLTSATADGFTFTIQSVAATAIGPGGSGLGYGAPQPNGTPGIGHSVAIKFDLYSNDGEGTDSTGVYTNGVSPTVPAVDMTASGLSLRSGDTMQAHITYDGSTLVMKLVDQVTNKSFTLSQAINIPQVIGGNTAFVGFTGGTGGLSAIQKVLSWAYTGQTPVPVTAAPVFSPAGGTYSSAQNVTITDATSGAVIYYTTDGSTPTTSSPVYSAPINVTASETVKAFAVAPGASPSSTTTAAYTIQSGTATINFANGFSSTTGLSLHGSSTVTNNLLQITNAATLGATGSAWFGTPVNISSFTTDFNFQLLSAQADGLTFTIQNTGPSVVGPAGSGLGYGASTPGGGGGIPKSVAVKFDIYSNLGEGTDSTGFYTNGASPTTPAIDMTASGVLLKSGHVMHAHITYDGTTLTLLLTDTATSATFTASSAVNIPSVVGASTAYVGFTGASGGLSMTTDILNWTLN